MQDYSAGMGIKTHINIYMLSLVWGFLWLYLLKLQILLFGKTFHPYIAPSFYTQRWMWDFTRSFLNFPDSFSDPAASILCFWSLIRSLPHHTLPPEALLASTTLVLWTLGSSFHLLPHAQPSSAQLKKTRLMNLVRSLKLLGKPFHFSHLSLTFLLIPHPDVQIHFHSRVFNLILPASFLGCDPMGSSPKRMKAFSTSPFSSVPPQILTCLSLSPDEFDKTFYTFYLTFLPPLGPYFINYSLFCNKRCSHKWTNLPFTFVPI